MRPRVFCTAVACALFIAASTCNAGKVIRVHIFVDEEEARAEGVWRNTLVQRVEAASQILASYADVSFAVRGTGHWDSDDRVNDFSASLAEFEKEADTSECRLAIGFSSQYRFKRGRNHLGGTRGPLQHHILLREGARPITEAERLEALVHEMGHFLCAAHSSVPNSAMRPVVGDGQARAVGYKIGIDPINAKIMRITAQELRDRDINRFSDLSPRSLLLLREGYTQLDQQLPKDPAAKGFLRVVNRLLHRPRIQPVPKSQPVPTKRRQVLKLPLPKPN